MNVVQLVAFFASQPMIGTHRGAAALKDRALSSYRMLLGAVLLQEPRTGIGDTEGTRLPTLRPDAGTRNDSTSDSSGDHKSDSKNGSRKSDIRRNRSTSGHGIHDSNHGSHSARASQPPLRPSSPSPPTSIPLPSRHPSYRIAFTVPWIGSAAPRKVVVAC